MGRYVARRVMSLIPVLTVVGVVVFSLVHLTPGDPARVMLGQSASPERIAQLRQELGLDDPLPLQFLFWARDVVSGDLGVSIYSGTPVAEIIATRIGPTASLTLLSMLFGLLIAIPSAMLAVWKRDSLWDPAFMSVSLVGISIPNFWLGIVLILIFPVTLGWLPVSGYVPLSAGLWPWLSHLLLPAIALSAQVAGLIARMLRDGMLEVINRSFIRTARAKGVTERIVLARHAFFNAMIPTTTVIGISFAGLLGGAVVIESIFAIPGVGSLVVESIARRDYPVLQGTVLFVAVMYVVVNLLVDLLYAVLDPRIRYQ